MDYQALDDLPPDAGEPEPVFSGSHPQQSRKRRWWIIALIVLALLLLVVGGAAVYVFHFKKQAPSQAVTQQSAQQSSQQPGPTATSSGDSSRVPYTSNGKDLNLSFTYPSDWSVTPPSANNPNDQTITLTTPLVTIVNSKGIATTARAVVAIRPGGTSASELASDKAIAALSSVQFAYAKPTASQHQYPFLTFVNLEGSKDTASSFDEVIVTGVTSFTKGQSVLPESVTQIDPLISARFYVCATSSCDISASAPLTIDSDNWQTNITCQQIRDLFASLELN